LTLVRILEKKKSFSKSNLSRSSKKMSDGELHVGFELPARYTIVKELSCGAFGEVFLAHDEDMKEFVVLKVLSDERAPLEARQKEAEISMKLHHPHIIKTYRVHHLADVTIIVQEYCEGGDLLDLISPLGGIGDEADIKKYFSQLVSAIKYMHDRDLVHRDIKPENVLLTSDDDVKLIDFGLSGAEDDQVEACVGTVAYMAPEVYRRSNHANDKSADLWALGIVLYNMIVGDLPWDTPSHHNSTFERYISLGRFDFKWSDSLHELMRGLLEPSLSRRFSIEDVERYMEAPWLPSFFWSEVHGSRSCLYDNSTFGVYQAADGSACKPSNSWGRRESDIRFLEDHPKALASIRSRLSFGDTDKELETLSSLCFNPLVDLPPRRPKYSESEYDIMFESEGSDLGTLKWADLRPDEDEDEDLSSDATVWHSYQAPFSTSSAPISIAEKELAWADLADEESIEDSMWQLRSDDSGIERSDTEKDVARSLETGKRGLSRPPTLVAGSA